MRFEGALPERREVVPLSFVKDAEGKRLLCGDFGRPPPRPSRSRLRRRRVCVCVLQRRRRAFLDSFPTHPSNIFESVRVARGGRSPSGTQSKVCDCTGWIYSPMSHQIGKKKPSRESSCVPRGESTASPASGLASYRLPKPNPARPKSWERSVVARRADGERRLLRVRRRGALHACGVARA